MSRITESARMENCQVRMADVCNFDPTTTVWAHANGSAAGKGLWMKSPDLLGAYACHKCHGVYDRQIPAPLGWTREEIEIAFWEGHARSVVLLIEKGIIEQVRGKVLA